MYDPSDKNPFKLLRKIHQKDWRRWLKDRWKVDDLKKFQWDLYGEEYKTHIWDGTSNPLSTAWDALVDQRWVGIESATSMGKTYFASTLALWFLDVFPGSLVVTIGASYKSLKDTLWMEIKNKYEKRYRRINTDAVWRDSLEISFFDKWVERESKMVGRGARVRAGEQSATSLQGLHNENMLILIDELVGVDASVIQAMKNTCTDANNLILGLGNPDSVIDNLHQFCLLDKVVHVRISAYDHPNIVCHDRLSEEGNEDKIKGAISPESIERRADEYGIEAPMFLSRVRGISPDQASNALISIANIEMCYQLDIEPDNSPNALGADTAQSLKGDKAAISCFTGNTLTYLTDFQCPNASALAINMLFNGSELIHELKNFKNSHLLDFNIPTIWELNVEEEMCAIDSSGIVSTLNEFYRRGYYVSPINASAPADERLIPLDDIGKPLYDFYNLRTQLIFMLKDAIDKRQISFKIDRPIFDNLKRELGSFQIDPNPNNRKIKLESKYLTKKRIGNSPNLADAVSYAYYLNRLYYEGLGSRGHRYGVHI